MLKNIDPRVTPELLYLLAQMGHGDTVAIVDRNFPAESSGVPVVHLPGLDLVEATEVVAALIPLDTFVEQPLAGMNRVDLPDEIPEVQVHAHAAIERIEGRTIGMERVERFAFYDRVKSAYAVVATTEDRPYGCIVLTKGVL